MPASREPHPIQLLAVLPAADFQRLPPPLEPADLPLGTIVFESGRKLRHQCFHSDGIVSLPKAMKNGASTEIAVLGNEGWSTSHCSWAAKAHPAGLWCGAPATATGLPQPC